MNTKKILVFSIMLLLVIIGVFTGWYFFHDNFTTSQFAKDGLTHCGSENNSHQPLIRQCILDALSTCKAAYAESLSDGVAWEASGGETSIEVKRGSNGDCGVQYVANGQSFSGPYSYDSFCKTVKTVGEQQQYLQVGDCENIENPQLF